MYDIDELQDGIEAVARHWETATLMRSPFHLTVCGGCGCPAFQQPCSLCCYYPMGDHRGSWNPHTATKEMFCTMVERSGPDGRDGTLATWLVRSSPKSFRDMDRAVASAMQVDVPSASDYWDAVTEDGHVLGRSRAEQGVVQGWRGMHEIRAIVLVDAGHGNPRLIEAAKTVLQDWAASIHADDRDAMASAAEAGRKLALVAVHSCKPVGNLRMAAEYLEEAAQGFSQPVLTM